MQSSAINSVILPERHIDQRVLQFITWPQYQYGCSIASLTCVINYLFADQIGVHTTKQIGKIVRVDPEELEQASTEELQAWFAAFCHKKGFSGKSKIAFNCGVVEDFDPDNWDSGLNNRVLARIDRVIRHKKKVLVYATDNHYLMVCGFYDASEDPDDVFVKAPNVRFYIFADHYQTNLIAELPRLLQTPAKKWLNANIEDWNLYLPGPILCKRWRDIWRDFRDRDQCFIVFERT